ncbi:alpha/beta fold hydrolase [Streptomyces sp. NPDC048639]|uniref:alpha/beta fold hydrolase n=1 Tax=Streptomyces sp. NPDC048639 TaxID=3365581 RepID=UPI0037141820
MDHLDHPDHRDRPDNRDDADHLHHPDLRADLDGLRLRYWQAGDHGSPVVLLHALGASVEFWSRTLPRLAEHHRVFALDLPGFGRSDKPRVRYTRAFLAETVWRFADAVGLDRVHLVGNSMGGAVSMECAIRSPERLHSLVLVCPAGLGRAVGPGPRTLSVPHVGEILTRPHREATRRSVLGCVHRPSTVPDGLVEAAFRHSADDGAAHGLLDTLRAFVRYDGQRMEVVDRYREGLAQIPAPVLMLTGEKDRMIPADYLDTVGAYPNVRTHEFADCGHYPQLEVPDEFSRVVLPFLHHAEGVLRD